MLRTILAAFVAPAAIAQASVRRNRLRRATPTRCIIAVRANQAASAL
jgi:hypothetical protein